MSNIRTFFDSKPIRRFDDLPFTQVEVQESLEAETGYSTISTTTLAPLDSDPRKPMKRDLTVNTAQYEEAWYRLVWKDEDGAQFTGDAIFFDATSIADPLDIDWRPDINKLEALLWVRARSSLGPEGKFTDETTPSRAQVEEHISMGTSAVAARIGLSPCREHLALQAGEMAALRAAMTIETAFKPEEVRQDRSAWPQFKSLYDDGMDALVEAVGEQCGGGTGEAVGDTTATRPAFGFPTVPRAGDRLY